MCIRDSYHTTEGPVDQSVPVCQCLVSAGQPGATGVPSLGTQGYLATSGRSWASLRALLTDPPQEGLDVRAQDDQAEVPDPDAEAYANVGASTSLTDPAVGAATDVRATTSLAIGLGQTTPHTLGSRSEADIGRAIGGYSAPAASELPSPPQCRSRPPTFHCRNTWRSDVTGILHYEHDVRLTVGL